MSLRQDSAPNLVIMTKRPEPGMVKTRLSESGALTLEMASAIAGAMLRCIVKRLDGRGVLWLVTSPDGMCDAVCEMLQIDVPATRRLDQGTGTLGDRLLRTWRTIHARRPRPTCFFGIDSPDLPASTIDSMLVASCGAECWVGPTFDGGYWTIGSRIPQPALLTGIDWGTEFVYDQTCAQARSAELALEILPSWHDVDEPEDLAALRCRLQDTQTDPSLGQLAEELDRICRCDSATADRSRRENQSIA